MQELSPYEELLAHFPEAAAFEKKEASPEVKADATPEVTEEEEVAEDAEAPAVETPVEEQEEQEKTEEPKAEPGELEKLKAQVEALQAKLNETERKPEPEAEEVVRGEDPLAHIENEKQLAEEIERARRITKWATANWDGIGPDGEPTTITTEKGEKVELTAAQVREHYARYRDVLDQAPLKAKQLAVTQEFNAEAERVYPELAKQGSEEAAMTAQLLKALPGIKQFPDWKLFVGDWLSGQKSRLAKAKVSSASKVASAKPELAPSVPKAAAPKIKSAAIAKTKAAEQVVASAGSREALEAYFLTTAN